MSTERRSFDNDYYTFSFIDSRRATRVDPYAVEGVGGIGGYPPEDGLTDGLLYQTTSRIVVRTGTEIGRVEVDVDWRESAPRGIYQSEGLASACDLLLPSGTVVMSDGYGRTVDRAEYTPNTRLRIFVAVVGRDVEVWQRPLLKEGSNPGELFSVTAWPVTEPHPWWCNERYDRTAESILRHDLKAQTTTEMHS